METNNPADNDPLPFDEYPEQHTFEPESGSMPDAVDAFADTGIIRYGEENLPEQQTYIADAQLTELLTTGNELLGQESLDVILAANEPFNHPVVTSPYGAEETVVDDNYQHRRVLQKLPAYVEASTEAGIAPEDTTTLITEAFGAVKSPDSQYPDIIVEGLTRILKTSAAHEQPITPEDRQAISATVAKAATAGCEVDALMLIRNGQEAGLNVQRSCELITEYYDTGDFRQSGYYSHHLSEALEALNVANADPAITSETFGYMNGQEAEARKDTYMGFKLLVGRIGPQLGYTANEVMSGINERVRTGMSVNDAIMSVASPAEQDQDRGRVADTDPTRYFAPTEGKLIHSYTPYRVERSLNDGIRDIEALTDASLHQGDTVAEGSWYVDRATNTWYSMGGETKMSGTSVRHEALAYDVGKLGNDIVQVHIHPNEYAFESILFGDVFPSGTDFTAVAEARDYASQPVRIQSLISHRFGITSFTYPSNNAAIRDMGQTFSEARNAMYGESFSNSDELLNYADAIGHEAFAQEAIAVMNERLPEGFSITLHPRGTEMETIIRDETPRQSELPDNTQTT